MPFARTDAGDLVDARIRGMAVAMPRAVRLLLLVGCVLTPSLCEGQRRALMLAAHGANTRLQTAWHDATPPAESRARLAVKGFVIGAIIGAIGAYAITHSEFGPPNNHAEVYKYLVPGTALGLAVSLAIVGSE